MLLVVDGVVRTLVGIERGVDLVGGKASFAGGGLESLVASVAGVSVSKNATTLAVGGGRRSIMRRSRGAPRQSRACPAADA